MLLAILHIPAFNFICTIFFTLIILFAFLILISANALFSVLSLVMVFILTSIIFILLGAEYLGLIYIIVYVGAIAILFLFVLMLLNMRVMFFDSEDLLRKCAVFCSVVISVEFLIFVFDLTPFAGYDFVVPEFNDDWLFADEVNDSIFPLSSVLFNFYSIYIILCAFILLVIMIGVILLVNITDGVPAQMTLAQRNKIVQDYLNSVRIARINYDFSRK
jgi:NADH-quinone oxidoreductase subunit J